MVVRTVVALLALASPFLLYAQDSLGEQCFKDYCIGFTPCDSSVECPAGTSCDVANTGGCIFNQNANVGSSCLFNEQCKTGNCSTAGGGVCAAEEIIDVAPVFTVPDAAGSDVNEPANPNGQAIIQNPLKAESLQALLAGVLRGVVRIGAIVLLMAFVWVGFLFVAAQGAEEKLRSARTNLVWTVVGGAILLGAELIAAIIEATAKTL